MNMGLSLFFVLLFCVLPLAAYSIAAGSVAIYLIVASNLTKK